MGTATDSECESLVLPHLADDEVFASDPSPAITVSGGRPDWTASATISRLNRFHIRRKTYAQLARPTFCPRSRSYRCAGAACAGGSTGNPNRFRNSGAWCSGCKNARGAKSTGRCPAVSVCFGNATTCVSRAASAQWTRGVQLRGREEGHDCGDSEQCLLGERCRLGPKERAEGRRRDMLVRQTILLLHRGPRGQLPGYSCVRRQ